MIDYSKILEGLISIGLIAVVATWSWDYFKNWQLNKQLKDLLTEELRDNLLVLNENIWWAKEPKGSKIPAYFLNEKAFNSLLASGKIVIFNTKQRKHLFRFYGGADIIHSIALNSNSLVSALKNGKQLKYYTDVLEATKKELKEILCLLGKEQLYEELKHKRTKHELFIK